MTSSHRREHRTGCRVELTDRVIRLWLHDGRTLTVPLDWYPQLKDAGDDRNTHMLVDGDAVIHWPTLGLDVPVVDLLTYSPPVGPAARRVEVTEQAIRLWLVDGRTLTVPTFWFPRLCDGSPDEWANIQVADDGGLRWPDLDEDLNVAGLLYGGWTGEGPCTLGRWLLARRAGRPVVHYGIAAYHKTLPAVGPLA